MKILLCSYRYYVSGGPERYMFNVTNVLAGRGHEIIPFSFKYGRNEPTPYERYFVNPVGGGDTVTFRERRLTPVTALRTILRLFYAKDVERGVTRIAEDTKPHIAYVLRSLRTFSPSLLVGLKKAGLPVVVRLSDYGMLCPQECCLRNDVPCELCVQGKLLPSVRYRCVHGNLAASVVNALAVWYHRLWGYFDLIDAFVTTNQFVHEMMQSAGFPAERLRCIPTFVDAGAFRPKPECPTDKYIVYSGRFDPIKGLEVLIDAMGILRRQRPDLSLRVKVAGAGPAAYSASLKERVKGAGVQDVVEFVGELSADKVSNLLGGALVSVVPSLWFENLPNSILESYACGTPVLASGLGSLTECVENGETGYLFRPGDPSSLAERIEHCLDHPQQVSRMSIMAREVAERKYSCASHVAALESLFTELVSGSPNGRVYSQLGR